MDTQLPIDLVQWAFALAPIMVLLVLLVILAWTAPQAAMVGMFTAAAIGFVVFQSPLETLAVAGAKGVWDAVFIIAVVWPARAAAVSSDEPRRRLCRTTSAHRSLQYTTSTPGQACPGRQ
jgi:hypothetical protein